MKVRILLVTLVVALGGALASLWLDESGQPLAFAWTAPAPLPPELSAGASAEAAAPANPAQFMAVLDRPMFAPDRRPPPPPAPPAPPPPPDPLANVTLYGLFGNGDSGGVLANFDGKVRRVHVNESIGDWTVKGIEGRSVTFARGDETRTLNLVANHGARKAPPTNSAAANPGAAPSPSAPMDRQALMQAEVEAARERLRQRNELFRKAGLPPVKE